MPRRPSFVMSYFLNRMALRRALTFSVIVLCFAHSANADTSNFAARAVATGDTRGQVFAVIDKAAATVSLYDAAGKFLAASPVLLGQAKGDASVPGIGDRAMADIQPHERTTPAGRFASEPGKNLSGETVVWIDYDTAVSMHRLRPSSQQEKRPERMASSTPLDNRITYGCVNVPAEFYDRWVLPTLGQTAGVVYVLPESQPAKKLFPFLR
ncbi:MAG: L,D-transpeptidase [Polaromonas sp.]